MTNEHENWIRWNCLEVAAKVNKYKQAAHIVEAAKSFEKFVLDIKPADILKIIPKRPYKIKGNKGWMDK